MNFRKYWQVFYWLSFKKNWFKGELDKLWLMEEI